MRFNILVLLLLICKFAFAYDIEGVIRDVKGEVIPFATLYVPDLTLGTTSNVDGKFALSFPSDKKYNVLIRCVGYKSQTITVGSDLSSPIEVKMQQMSLQLPDVVVGNGEDPAYRVMRNTIGLRHQHLKEISSYLANIYLRGTIAFSKISRLMSYQIKKREGVDIREGDVFVDESFRQVIYAYPGQYKQKVIQHKSSMPIELDLPILDYIGASLYQPSIEIMISPFSPSAFRHYKFRYEGFFYDGDYSVNIISVIPRIKSKQLFYGKIYIVEGLWCIHSVDLTFDTPVGPVKMHQNYQEIKNKVWLPVDHRYEFNGGALGVKGKVLYVANFKYLNVELNPTFHPEVKESPVLASQKEQKTIKIVSHKTDKKKIPKVKKEEQVASLLPEVDVKDFKFTVKEYQNAPLDSFRSVPLSALEVKSLKSAQQKDQLKSRDRASRGEKSSFSKTMDFMNGKTYFSKDSVFRVRSPRFLSPSALRYNPVDGFMYNIDSEMSWYSNHKLRTKIDLKAGYSFGLDKFNWDIKWSLPYSLYNSFNISAGSYTQDFNRYRVDPVMNSISSFFIGDNFKKYYERSYVKCLHRFSTDKWWSNETSFSFKSVKELDNSINENVFGKSFTENVPKGEYIYNENLASQNYFRIGTKFNARLAFLDNRKASKYRNLRVYAPDVNVSYDFYKLSDGKLVQKSELGISQKIKTTPSAWIRWDFWTGKMWGDTQDLHMSEFYNYEIQPIPIRLNNHYFSFYNIDAYSMASNDLYLKTKVIYRTPYLLLKFLPFLSSSLSREQIYAGLIYTPRNKYYEVGYAFTELLFLFDVYVSSSFDQNGFQNIGVSLVLDL